jgi:iron complex outermembrane receptor protein
MTKSRPLRSVRTTSALLLASTMLGTSGAALAQEPQAAADDGGDVIIVTATRREENIQRVPISLQALGSQTLEQHQTASFDDYAKLLPSVSYQSFGPGQSQLFFRGIASGGDGLPGGALPTTGVYLDEVPVTTIGAMLDVHIYDISRVEALSGPQGTLFGASSLSGTMRIITNKPTASRFEGGYDLQLNKFGKGDIGGSAEAFVNLPLSETVALRVSGFYERVGGYIDNTPGTRVYTLSDSDPTNDKTVSNTALVEDDFNDVETYGGRAALKVDLDDDWTATLSGLAQHQQTNGSFLYDPRVGDLEVHDFVPSHTQDKWYLAALTIEGKLSDWDIVYSGSIHQRSLDITSDYSYYTVYYDNVPGYTNFPLPSGGYLDPTQKFHNKQQLTKQTHEFRVSSPATDRFRMTAGMFMQRQSNTNLAEYNIPGLASTGLGLNVQGDNIFLTDTEIIARDYAAFAQSSFDITPSLTLTGGIRAFWYHNTLTGFSGFASNAAGAGCTVPITIGSCQTIDKKASESGETHKVTLTWQADEDRMLYATYSTGFRPGGNNRRPGINPYSPDTIDNFELGWKTSWLDGKLRINGAAYYQEWKALQYALSPPGSVGVTNVYNAGDARVYGVELDFFWRMGALTLSGTGAYNNAALKTNFCAIDLTTGNPFPTCSGATISAPKGTRLPIQPEFKGTVTGRYEFDIGGGESFVQASVLHQTSTTSYLGPVEAAILEDTPPFTTVDFSVGTKIGDISLEAFIQNAFDERGELSHNSFCAPVYCGQYYRIYPIKPQLFGIKVAQRF